MQSSFPHLPDTLLQTLRQLQPAHVSEGAQQTGVVGPVSSQGFSLPPALQVPNLNDSSTGVRLDLSLHPSKPKPSAKKPRVSRTELIPTASEQERVRTIDHLPNEILLIIFDLVTAPPPSDPMAHNFPWVVLLTHVSRRWMGILINCGRIWSNIHIHGQDSNILSAQVERCQVAPLKVSIRKPHRRVVESSPLSELQKNFKEAANLIRGHRDRVTRLHVRMDCRSFQQLLGCEWPSLKKLGLIDACSLGSSSHGDGYDGRLPRLKVLSICGRSTWPMKVATNLTVFKLRGPVELELATLSEFLRRNTSLEYLNLIDLSVREPPSYRREEPVDLPHLEKLSVVDATCESALALLKPSSLRKLHVSSSTIRHSWSYPCLSELYSQLPITSIGARYFPPSRDRIIVVGSNGLDTWSLLLQEFWPNILRTALFKSLSNASFPSVTSVSLIEDMPNSMASSTLIAAICDLLEHLPRVEFMRLFPSRLAIGALQQLSGSSELCPELRKLEVAVTNEDCEKVVELVGEILKVPADGYNGRKIRSVEYLYPKDSQQYLEAEWDRLWRGAGLQRHLRIVDE